MKQKPYIRYGDQWRKEVMKHPKQLIVDMLKDVALERDRLEKKIKKLEARPSPIEKEGE